MNVKHGGSGANPERYPAALIKAWQVTKRSPTISARNDKTYLNRNLWCQWQISIANEWLFKSIWYSLRPAPYYTGTLRSNQTQHTKNFLLPSTPSNERRKFCIKTFVILVKYFSQFFNDEERVCVWIRDKRPAHCFVSWNWLNFFKLTGKQMELRKLHEIQLWKSIFFSDQVSIETANGFLSFIVLLN